MASLPQVPSNLIPTSIGGLPQAPAGVTAANSTMIVVYQGSTYQVNAGDIVSTTGVPITRQVIAGTGMTGGGQLSSNVTLSIANGGVGTSQLANTGVTAGVYGSSTEVPVFTVDATGRVTAATTTTVSVSGYVPTTRQVIAGTGLTGGGALSGDVTLNASLSDTTPESGYQTGSAGASTSTARGDHKHPAVDLASDDEVDGLLGIDNGGTGRSLVPDEGAIIWCGADGLYVGPVGDAGQVLVSNGTGAYGWGSALVISNQPANYVYAGPASGPDAPTAFRALVNDDVPTALTGKTIDNTIIGATTPAAATFTTATATDVNATTVDTTNIEVTNLKAKDGTAAGSIADGTGVITLNNVDINAGEATLTGSLVLPASTASLVPLHLTQGVSPTTPVDGDVWFDQNGIYMQNLSAIHQLDADANAVGALSRVVITDNGNGTVNASSIEVFIYAASGWQGNYMRRTVPAATNLTLVAGANYLTAIYNGGAPIFQITQTASAVNNSNVLLIANMWLDGTQIHYTVVNWGLATATRLNDRLVNVQRYVRTSGLMLGESATPTARTITATSGLVWYGITAVSEPAVDSASSNCDFYYHVAGVWTKSSVSVYNNTQYDNGTNLVALSGGGTQYAVNWVYRYIDGSALPKLAYVLGSGNYNLAQAQASTAPTPPPILTAQAILIGRIIVAENASTATQIDSAFTTVFSGSTVTDHNNLAGLQGGTTSEYYHLTAAEYTGTGTGVFARQAAPTFTDTVTIPSVNMGLQSIATSGGTTTFTASTVDYTIFTGNQGQTLILPNATTLVAGRKFRIDNNSTQAIQVKTNDGADLWQIAPGTDLYLTVTSTATAAGTWENDYTAARLSSGKVLNVSNTFTMTGTDGSSVAFGTGGTVLYSGGALGTPSSGTLTNCSGLSLTSGVTGVLPIANGGTGTTHGIDGGTF